MSPFNVKALTKVTDKYIQHAIIITIYVINSNDVV